MNWVTLLVCYVELVKIFWNWFDNNLRKKRLSSQVICNREKILKESDMKIKTYRENTEEIYQYIRDNQNDANKVKRSVSSLRNLLNEYEREVKEYLRREYKEIMTINVRKKVSELENDLLVIRQYRKNINCYRNLGLIIKRNKK